MSPVLCSSSPLMILGRDKNNRQSPLALMKKGLFFMFVCLFVFLNGIKIYKSDFKYISFWELVCEFH